MLGRGQTMLSRQQQQAADQVIHRGGYRDVFGSGQHGAHPVGSPRHWRSGLSFTNKDVDQATEKINGRSGAEHLTMQQIYIQRDAAGQITGLSSQPEDDRAELASLADPQVQQFLRHLDLDLVRVLEDVIDLLVARGVFRFTDLPDSAQEKLLFRKTLRSRWSAVDDPLGEADDLL
jgi:hypothetical protein